MLAAGPALLAAGVFVQGLGDEVGGTHRARGGIRIAQACGGGHQRRQTFAAANADEVPSKAAGRAGRGRGGVSKKEEGGSRAKGGVGEGRAMLSVWL